MKAGARIQFSMHYHAVGQEITDRTSVGIVFYPKGYAPKHVIKTVQVGTLDLDIGAGEDNVRSDAYYKLEKPVRLVSFQPHMHGSRQGRVRRGDLPEHASEATELCEPLH